MLMVIFRVEWKGLGLGIQGVSNSNEEKLDRLYFFVKVSEPQAKIHEGRDPLLDVTGTLREGFSGLGTEFAELSCNDLLW